LVALRQQEAALVRGGRKGHLAVFQQLAGLGQGMGFQMRFQLGQPDFESGTASVGVGVDVVSEGGGGSSSLADKRAHISMLGARGANANGIRGVRLRSVNRWICVRVPLEGCAPEPWRSPSRFQSLKRRLR